MKATVGPYTLVRPLGAGATADVFLAHDPDGQVVAIKCWRHQDAGPPALREWGAVLRLQHRRIVRGRDFVYLGPEEMALIYDYVPGGNLRELLEARGPLSWRLVRRLCRQILEGLGYLHEHGLIHCDLKPDNILVATPEPLEIKLGDLGSVLRIEELRRGQTSQTGTPAYVAPERLYNEFAPNSDLYSLGILAIEMLRGKPPVEGTVEEIIRQHLQGELDFAGVPEAALAWLRPLLARDPAERFADARAASTALSATAQARRRVVAVGTPPSIPRIAPTTLFLPLEGPIETLWLRNTAHAQRAFCCLAHRLIVYEFSGQHIRQQWALALEGSAVAVTSCGEVLFTRGLELRRWHPGQACQAVAQLPQAVTRLRTIPGVPALVASGPGGAGLIELETGRQTWHRERACGLSSEAAGLPDGTICRTVGSLRNRLLAEDPHGRRQWWNLPGACLELHALENSLGALCLALDETHLALFILPHGSQSPLVYPLPHLPRAHCLAGDGLYAQLVDGQVVTYRATGRQALMPCLPPALALAVHGNQLAALHDGLRKRFVLAIHQIPIGS